MTELQNIPKTLCYFSSLLDECTTHIISFLRAVEIASCSEVNKKIFSKARIQKAIKFQLQYVYSPLMLSLSPNSIPNTSAALAVHDYECRCDVLYTKEVKLILSALNYSQGQIKGYWVSTSWLSNTKKYFEALTLPTIVYDILSNSSMNTNSKSARKTASNKKSSKIRQRRGSDVSSFISTLFILHLFTKLFIKLFIFHLFFIQALPPWPCMNSDIMCVHGNLALSKNSKSKRKLIDKKVWNILRKYYPRGPGFKYPSHVSGNECEECQATNSEANKLLSARKELEVSKRKILFEDLRALMMRRTGVPNHLVKRTRSSSASSSASMQSNQSADVDVDVDEDLDNISYSYSLDDVESVVSSSSSFAVSDNNHSPSPPSPRTPHSISPFSSVTDLHQQQQQSAETADAPSTLVEGINTRAPITPTNSSVAIAIAVSPATTTTTTVMSSNHEHDNNTLAERYPSCWNQSANNSSSGSCSSSEDCRSYSFNTEEEEEEGPLPLLSITNNNNNNKNNMKQGEGRGSMMKTKVAVMNHERTTSTVTPQKHSHSVNKKNKRVNGKAITITLEQFLNPTTSNNNNNNNNNNSHHSNKRFTSIADTTTQSDLTRHTTKSHTTNICYYDDDDDQCLKDIDLSFWEPVLVSNESSESITASVSAATTANITNTTIAVKDMTTSSSSSSSSSCSETPPSVNNTDNTNNTELDVDVDRDIALALQLQEQYDIEYQQQSSSSLFNNHQSVSAETAAATVLGLGSMDVSLLRQPLQPGVYNIVSREWLKKWRSWVLKGSFSSSSSSNSHNHQKPPSGTMAVNTSANTSTYNNNSSNNSGAGSQCLPLLDCTHFLCHTHGRLIVPPHLEEYLHGYRKSLLTGLADYPGEVHIAYRSIYI